MWIFVGRGVGDLLRRLRGDRDLDLFLVVLFSSFSLTGVSFLSFSLVSFLTSAFSFSRSSFLSLFSLSFSFWSRVRLLLRLLTFLVVDRDLLFGLVLSLLLEELEESELELLDREDEAELELLDDLELEELLSDELLWLSSLLLEPDSERFLRSFAFSFFLSFGSGSDSVPGLAILKMNGEVLV